MTVSKVTEIVFLSLRLDQCALWEPSKSDRLSDESYTPIDTHWIRVPPFSLTYTPIKLGLSCHQSSAILQLHRLLPVPSTWPQTIMMAFKLLLASASVIAVAHGAPLVTCPDGNMAENAACCPLFALRADLQAHLSVTIIFSLVSLS